MLSLRQIFRTIRQLPRGASLCYLPANFRNNATSGTTGKGGVMAVDFSGSSKAMDVREHERTFDGFVKATIYGTAAVLVLLALMAFFLV
jgi:hypothetical protein